MVSLNQRINDAIGSGETGLHIDRNDLPKPESWSCVCKELQRNGLQNVKIDADGTASKYFFKQACPAERNKE